MVTKKFFNMDTLIDAAMTRLFQLAEYVCSKAACFYPKASYAYLTEKPGEPVAPTLSAPQQESVPTIRFSEQDRMVEGELFE